MSQFIHSAYLRWEESCIGGLLSGVAGSAVLLTTPHPVSMGLAMIGVALFSAIEAWHGEREPQNPTEEMLSKAPRLLGAQNALSWLLGESPAAVGVLALGAWLVYASLCWLRPLEVLISLLGSLSGTWLHPVGLLLEGGMQLLQYVESVGAFGCAILAAMGLGYFATMALGLLGVARLKDRDP